jgi:hypothetical protein
MSAQRSEYKKILSIGFLSASLFLVFSGVRAQAPELQGLPPGQFDSSPPGLIAGLDPVAAGLPAATGAVPGKVAATPRMDPISRKPAAQLQTSPPGPWMTALLALAGLVGVGLAVVVLTLAVREMRREAVERRRFRRRRVARRPNNAPELDARWLPRQRGLFDN